MLEMTKKTVQKLLDETGHAIRVEDFDLCAELDELARRIVKSTPEEKRLLSQPFELCDVLFYPLTIAKSTWFAEKCEEWSIEGIWQDALLFWLLSVPNNEAALTSYSKRKDAETAAKRLSRRLHCTQDEMTEVFNLCVGRKAGKSGADGKTEDAEDVSYGAIIAVLLREYGGNPEQWLYETPIEQVGVLIEQYVFRLNSENEAAGHRSSSKGQAVAPPPTAKLKALRDYRLKANEIRKQWTAVKDG